jgi:mannose-6-phosphate isomerase-like protein (cupin superfamily)
MTTTRDIPAGSRIDLAREVVGIGADRRASFVVQTPGRPPKRIDGFTVGVAPVGGPAPHGGEMHSDGDELLHLISGAITVTLELADGDQRIDLGAGDAFVVPQGVWHQIAVREPGQLVHITPGPNGAARPRAAADERVDQ